MAHTLAGPLSPLSLIVVTAVLARPGSPAPAAWPRKRCAVGAASKAPLSSLGDAWVKGHRVPGGGDDALHLRPFDNSPTHCLQSCSRPQWGQAGSGLWGRHPTTCVSILVRGDRGTQCPQGLSGPAECFLYGRDQRSPSVPKTALRLLGSCKGTEHSRAPPPPQNSESIIPEPHPRHW